MHHIFLHGICFIFDIFSCCWLVFVFGSIWNDSENVLTLFSNHVEIQLNLYTKGVISDERWLREEISKYSDIWQLFYYRVMHGDNRCMNSFFRVSFWIFNRFSELILPSDIFTGDRFNSRKQLFMRICPLLLSQQSLRHLNLPSFLPLFNFHYPWY